MGAWVALGEFNGSKKPEYIYTVKRWDESIPAQNRYDQAAAGRYPDGQLGCSCPAWKFFYRSHPRTERIWCKHTRRVEENPRIFDEANEAAAQGVRRRARGAALYEHIVASGVLMLYATATDGVRQAIAGGARHRGADFVFDLLSRLDADASLFTPAPMPAAPKPGRRGLRRITLDDE